MFVLFLSAGFPRNEDIVIVNFFYVHVCVFHFIGF